MSAIPAISVSAFAPAPPPVDLPSDAPHPSSPSSSSILPSASEHFCRLADAAALHIALPASVAAPAVTTSMLAPSLVQDPDTPQLPDGVVPVTAVARLSDLHHWFNHNVPFCSRCGEDCTEELQRQGSADDTWCDRCGFEPLSMAWDEEAAYDHGYGAMCLQCGHVQAAGVVMCLHCGGVALPDCTDYHQVFGATYSREGVVWIGRALDGLHHGLFRRILRHGGLGAADADELARVSALHSARSVAASAALAAAQLHMPAPAAAAALGLHPLAPLAPPLGATAAITQPVPLAGGPAGFAAVAGALAGASAAIDDGTGPAGPDASAAASGPGAPAAAALQ